MPRGEEGETYFLEADLYSFVFLISTFAGSGVLFPGVILFCAGCVGCVEEEPFSSRWRISSAEMTRRFDCCVGNVIVLIFFTFFPFVILFWWY